MIKYQLVDSLLDSDSDSTIWSFNNNYSKMELEGAVHYSVEFLERKKSVDRLLRCPAL